MRFSFFLTEAWESLRRNWVMTLASILTVFISMGILGAVLVIDRNLVSCRTWHDYGTGFFKTFIEQLKRQSA